MIKIEKVTYAGWNNCYRINNSNIEIIATSDVGPRIISFGFIGKENLFYQNPSEMGKVGGDSWMVYGGHRLWLAPEIPERTYFPDNYPVEVDIQDDGIVLTSPIEKSTGIQKTIEIQMAPNQSKVCVNHIIRNHNLWPVTFAPWAITALSENGVTVLPHQNNKPHQESVLPTHSISLWSYTQLTDPRLTWGDENILLRQDPKLSNPQKIGMNNSCGWAAYIKKETAFIKFFSNTPELKYPDFNCNVEAYTNQYFLELETLGPIKTVNSNESVNYLETWILAEIVQAPQNDVEVNQFLMPYINNFL